MGFRHHGGVSFADLVDGSGRIQLQARQDLLGEKDYGLFLLLHRGDIVGVEGRVFRTRRGEVTVGVEGFCLLAKCLEPLPEKWHGLREVEIRYRRRYLDLIANPEARRVLLTRSRIVSLLRRFLEERGFVEVETPVLTPLYGGARARPFTTYHRALEMPLYLRIAPELYLKRLVVGGMERVFEIGKVFRNEGLSPLHNPEFTMLELYQAFADYEDMMRLTEEIFAFLAQEINGRFTVTFRGKEIDLQPPWPRLSMVEALRERLGCDVLAWRSDEEARLEARRLGLEVEEGATRGRVMEELVDAFVQPHLIQPTFLIGHPVDISPLARAREDDPRLSYRFELIVGGWELANAFSELADPFEQRERFQKQQEERAKGDEEAHAMDEDFLRALECGLPPTGGLGIGIDRLAMLLTGQDSIREVIPFPLLRPVQEE
jgi:lysyl-tRNA synthetase class 2